ncbi:YjdF family protein [Oscillibacter sp. MSJ-2]|uniref:YjdF family protein n=1 Tax=Dysosmobacter acutus TaxID=2841504 RepID=A0ABS6FAN7_9FIRM|nr:YjdF family protein [Dysosmobacter acutus]MBU5627346.1 YjdF family protein [Dysosmobacter acutus]
MEENGSSLTVFFDPPFWVGVFERWSQGRWEACKVVFGAEPKEGELYGFLLRHYDHLRFSPSVEGFCSANKASNPKRAQRQAERLLSSSGVGTKAQQALQLYREQCKIERSVRVRARHQAEKDRRFDLRQKKRREKHKGH